MRNFPEAIKLENLTKEAAPGETCWEMEANGTLECMDYAAAVMFCLGDFLFVSDEKIRVTIERDPETRRFTIKRKVLS